MNQQSTLEKFENYESKIKLFSQHELIHTAKDLFVKEKKISDAILVVLGELQQRRIYSELGFSSLFEMLVKFFKLSESSAYQKMSLIKLIKEVPAAKEALLDGSASVSNLVLANSFINEKNKNDSQKLTSFEKNEIIDQIKNKSYKEAKEQLAILNPQPALTIDKIKPINQNQVNIQCTIDKALQQKLEHIKNLISHKNPNPTMNTLINIIADIAIEHIEKKKGIDKKNEKEVHMYRNVCVKEDSNKKRFSTFTESQFGHDIPFSQILNEQKQAPEMQFKYNVQLAQSPKRPGQEPELQSKKRSRYIAKDVRRAIYQRAHGQCQYVSPEGKRCECKRFLQFEHSIPFAKGGMNDKSTLQLYCVEHNALKAKKDFGVDPRKYKRTESAIHR